MFKNFFFPFRKPSDEKFTYGDLSNRFFAFGFDMIISFFFIYYITIAVMGIMFPEGNPMDTLRSQAIQEHPELAQDSAALTKYVALKNPEAFRSSVNQFIFGTVFQLILLGVYFIIMTWKKGATIGKMIVGLKVIDNITNEKITLSQSIIRYISYIPSLGVFGLGLIWGSLHDRRRCWHDLLADTIVVVDENRWIKKLTGRVKAYFNLK